MLALLAIFLFFYARIDFFHSSSYAYMKKHSELPFPNARIYLRKTTPNLPFRTSIKSVSLVMMSLAS